MYEKSEQKSDFEILSREKNSERLKQAHCRRAFLKGLGVAGVAVPLAVVAARAAGQHPDVLSDTHTQVLDIKNRRDQAFNKRLGAAADDHAVKAPPHPNNGDEATYPSGIANFTKGFAHNSFGEVDPGVYASYQAAVNTGKRQDFDALVMGGTEALVDPQAGLAYDLESYDPSQISIPPADKLNSPDLAAQLIELYWQALARDVPFSQYGTDPTVAAAASELTGLSSFVGPRIGGDVTPQSIFRGFTAGDLIGPYISQFYLQPFSYGAMPFVGYTTTLSGTDFAIEPRTWLNVQNGAPAPLESGYPDPQLRYLRSGRDMAEYVHNDVLYQEYLNATLILIKMRAPLNSGNLYPPTLKSACLEGLVLDSQLGLNAVVPSQNLKPGRIDDEARRGLVLLRCGRSSADAENPAHACPMRDASGSGCNRKRNSSERGATALRRTRPSDFSRPKAALDS